MEPVVQRLVFFLRFYLRVGIVFVLRGQFRLLFRQNSFRGFFFLRDRLLGFLFGRDFLNGDFHVCFRFDGELCARILVGFFRNFLRR